MDNRILVVDDIDINRDMLTELLKNEYDVLVADGGRQAIEMLDKHKKDISMVLLDVIMPEVSGYDVLHYMGFHDMLRDIPVMLITAAGSDEMEEKGLALGAVDYIASLLHRISYAVVRVRSSTFINTRIIWKRQ